MGSFDMVRLSSPQVAQDRSFNGNAKWYLLGILFLANFFIWYTIFVETRKGVLTVAFLDVGQGDAIFIEAPNGNQMLIDGGPNQKVLSELSSRMPFYDRSIDVLLATHPDKDHIGGFPRVFERYKVPLFIDPGAKAETGIYEALQEAVFGEKGEYVRARRGMKIFLDDEVYFLVLFPDRDVENVETNDASIVGKLVYGETSFLFTGDAPRKIEEYISTLDKNVLKSDVLKVGHHGSRTSTGDTLLGYASPLWAVLSLGEDNTYGHPHREVLEALERFHIPVLRTDERGTIVFESNGKEVHIIP